MAKFKASVYRKKLASLNGHGKKKTTRTMKSKAMKAAWK